MSENSFKSDPAVQRLKTLLDSRPSKGYALVMQAIILALIVHIFFLSFLYIVTASPQGQAADQDAVVEELDLQFAPEEEILQDQEQMPSNMSEDVRNLLANASSERTNDQVNFSGKTKAEIEAEVLQNLKGLEQSEFDQLKSTHKDFSVKDPNDPTKNAKDNKDAAKDNYEWYKNQSEKSFSGPVSAEYDLPGRSAKSTPRPTYRCKSSGKVVVKIEVDKAGAVVEASIDESKTTGNDCIREESLSYARKWKFDYKEDASKKQNGSITFTFSAQ